MLSFPLLDYDACVRVSVSHISHNWEYQKAYSLVLVDKFFTAETDFCHRFIYTLQRDRTSSVHLVLVVMLRKAVNQILN